MSRELEEFVTPTRRVIAEGIDIDRVREPYACLSMADRIEAWALVVQPLVRDIPMAKRLHAQTGDLLGEAFGPASAASLTHKG